MDGLRESIVKVLPAPPPATVLNLVHRMTDENGLVDMQDVVHVCMEDFGKLLKPIQARKLPAAWKLGVTSRMYQFPPFF